MTRTGLSLGTPQYMSPEQAMGEKDGRCPGRSLRPGRASEPRWARSGRELFFESGGNLVSVAVGAGATLGVSEPKVLFPVLGYRRARNRPEYDVAPDGAGLGDTIVVRAVD